MRGSVAIDVEALVGRRQRNELIGSRIGMAGVGLNGTLDMRLPCNFNHSPPLIYTSTTSYILLTFVHSRHDPLDYFSACVSFIMAPGASVLVQCPSLPRHAIHTILGQAFSDAITNRRPSDQAQGPA